LLDQAEIENSPLFEIALVLVRFNHAARWIVNANHGVMRTAAAFSGRDRGQAITQLTKRMKVGERASGK
jgi:hypothetical protein